MRVTGYLVEPSERTPYYQLRYKTAGERKYRSRSLGVRTKEAAQKRMTEFLVELEHELCDLIPRKAIREAAGLDLEKFLERFAADLRANDRDDKYIENGLRFVRIPARACGWRTVPQITAESFISWRAAQASMSASTKRHYLAGLNTFLNWLVKQDLIERNPLARIPKAKSVEPTRKRRALTHDEAKRLLDVASPSRRLVYLLALLSGLRRDELRLLEWGRPPRRSEPLHSDEAIHDEEPEI